MMDTSGIPADDGGSLIKVKEETKCVLEAFLKRSLSQDEAIHLGHVGGVYHDPKKYSHRTNQEEIKDDVTKRGKKVEPRRTKVSGKDKDERSHSLTFNEAHSHNNSGKWNDLLDEINRVEETKHGFTTNFKKLLGKHSQNKEKATTPKEKNGSLHSKSRGSIESVLEDHRKDVAKGDSLKRPKSPNPLLACTVAASTISLSDEDQKPNDIESHEKQGTQRKLSRPFSFKKLKFKKKIKDESSATDTAPVRPNFLPVTPYFESEGSPHYKTGKLEDSEIYSLAAKKLETLLKHKKVKSPLEPQQPVGYSEKVPRAPPAAGAENNNVTANDKADAEDKEEIIRKLVVLLQEQAVVINEKINKDPFLRTTLARMSYGSFFRLAEVFTSQAEVETTQVGASVSPELTKIALTMELTRKVAGINSHAVHQLMGYSLQYMDMFVPWLQKQGGWENIVSNGDIADLQID
ncbi:bcl-2-like protein 12 [Rana temporaria]|uniref:bcl-2-like protein 12 n=1 Tax=Rana temporaria TaxID=8407 RepID=UPI001AAD52F2|nr:bcl-2-like protein 12 [Rana temporaria]